MDSHKAVNAQNDSTFEFIAGSKAPRFQSFGKKSGLRTILFT
jgi:hypothetical protein